MHVVAQRDQPAGRHAPHAVVVLDHQDGATATRRRAARARLGAQRAGRGGARQQDRDGGALVHFAVDLHLTAGLFDEPPHGAEAQARARAGTLGGEERFEDAVADVGRDTGAGVGHVDAHIVAGAGVQVGLHIVLVQPGVGDADGQRARAGHGVARVDRQVDQRVFHLAGVGAHRPQVSGDVQVDGHAFAQHPLQHVGHRKHQAAQFHILRLQRLSAGEGQQPLGQLGAQFGGLLGVGQDVGQCRVVADAVFQHLQIALDHRQQVVEVVRHAAGQLAQRLDLLVLAQHVLVAADFGDVAHDPHFVVAGHRTGELDQALFAVPAGDDHLARLGKAGGPVGLVQPADIRFVLAVQGRRPGVDIGQLRPVVSSDLFGRPVERDGLAAHVDGADRHVFDQLGQARFALAQGRLGRLALADVADDAGEQLGVALAHLADGQVHGKPGAVLAHRLHLAADADDFGLTGFQEAFDVSVVPRPVGFGHQDVHVAADQLAGGVAEHPPGGRIDRPDGARRVDGDDAVDHRVDHRGHLAFAQFVLGGQRCPLPPCRPPGQEPGDQCRDGDGRCRRHRQHDQAGGVKAPGRLGLAKAGGHPLADQRGHDDRRDDGWCALLHRGHFTTPARAVVQRGRAFPCSLIAINVDCCPPASMNRTF